MDVTDAIKDAWKNIGSKDMLNGLLNSEEIKVASRDIKKPSICSKEEWAKASDRVEKKMPTLELSTKSAVFYQSVCPKCNAVNWVYGGGIEYNSGIPFHGCLCHNCQSIFWICEEVKNHFKDGLIMSEVFDYQTVENVVVQNGTKEPYYKFNPEERKE